MTAAREHVTGPYAHDHDYAYATFDEMSSNPYTSIICTRCHAAWELRPGLGSDPVETEAGDPTLCDLIPWNEYVKTKGPVRMVAL